MSGFVATASPVNHIKAHDARLNDPLFQPVGALFAECISAIAPASFQSEWWPGGGFMGDSGADVGVIARSLPFAPFYPASGASMRFGFYGITRDAYGTAVGSVTVKLFRTADDVLLDTRTSDPTTGEFLLSTAYYPDQHYITAHKSASPDIDGVTRNTLVGT